MDILLKLQLIYFSLLQTSSSGRQRQNVTYSARLGKHRGMIAHTVCFKATLKVLVFNWLGSDRYFFSWGRLAIFLGTECFCHLQVVRDIFWWALHCSLYKSF